MGLPFHLVPGTWVVLEGPSGAGKTAVLDGLWRAAHGLGHGPRPLFDRMPVFTQRPNQPEWRPGHLATVVEPALAAGRSVFMERCSWTGRVDAESELFASAHAVDSQSDPQPTLIAVINPDGDPVRGPRYRALVAQAGGRGVVLNGNVSAITESLFDALIARELFMAAPPARGSRP